MSAGTTALPVTVTLCGLETALSEICSQAILLPGALPGAKVTFTVQVAPAGRVEGLIGQLLVCLKLPAFVPTMPIVVMVRGAGPALVSVTGCGALEVNTV